MQYKDITGTYGTDRMESHWDLLPEKKCKKHQPNTTSILFVCTVRRELGTTCGQDSKD